MISNPKSKYKKPLLTAVKVILTVVIIYFLYYQVSKHWQEIKEHDWSIDYILVIISVLVALLALFVFSIIWRLIIRGFGHDIGCSKAFRIFYLSNLGRYIPGKIWQLFGILYLTAKEKIPPETAGASFVLTQMFAIPASFLVFIVSAQLEPRILVDRVALLGDNTAYLFAAVMILLSVFIVMKPNLILKWVNVVLRKMSRSEVTFRLDKIVAIKIFLGYCIAWILYGIAFWLFINSVIKSDSLSLTAAIGIFNASYQIGYLVLFAPGGFGPRELVMGVMLTPFLGPVAMAAAILSRIWAIVVESIAALAALIIKK